MRRLLPQSLISLLLFVVWLLLNNSIHPAHLVLGAVLALLIPLWTANFGMQPVQIRQPLTIIILAMIVLYDIIKSNIDVARLILGREENIHPAFVWIPLDISDPTAKSALAGIITMTPGTLSADFSADGKFLLIHALNVPNAAVLVADIKARYETPLKDIFEDDC